MVEINYYSDSDGERLVKLARLAVKEYLQNGKKIKSMDQNNSRFSLKSGIFVTLNNQTGLRGCIGLPMPNQKLFDGLVDAAIGAACEDPRFVPVKFDELEQITFEVTILTSPKEIKVSNPLEYPTKIKVGKDGLIVKYVFNSGLLLPQVPAEYGWTEEEFLSHTCEKAGLVADFWKEGKAEIFKFEGIVFKEEKPNGNVIRLNL